MAVPPVPLDLIDAPDTPSFRPPPRASTGGASGASTPTALFSAGTGSRSPRFRALVRGISGLHRLEALADDVGPGHQDIAGIVQRVAMTLSSAETYKKVCRSIFEKFAAETRQPDGSLKRQLPVSRLGEVLAHWHIPGENVMFFSALLRKHASIPFESHVLLPTVSFEDFEVVLGKVLRRVRDKYCPQQVHRGQFVTQNTRRLEDEYAAKDQVGAGAFGQCQLVQHRVSKKRRVCKRIEKVDARVPPEEVVNELDALKRLDHPNVVRVFEWFESDQEYLIVMEEAQGGDLRKLLAKAAEEGGPGLEEPLVIMLAMQSFRGLAYVHSQRVMHRDIKPANMLLATADVERPRLLLADFGLAEFYEQNRAMQIKGSAPYMSPEVFLNEASPYSDIWALGIVIYELLCGSRPFRAENPMAMFALLKRATAKLEPLAEVGVSSVGQTFVGQCLQKDEAHRPSASEALRHEWLSSSISPRQLTARNSRKLKRGVVGFMRSSYFAKAAMNCVAAQLDTSRIEGLSAIFESLDMDQDGRLSPAELAAGLAEIGVDPDAIGQVVDALDVSNDGHVSYSEFIACLLQTQGHMVDEAIHHAFQVIDVNNDGAISLDELCSMLNGDGPLAAVLPDGKTVADVLREVDTSNNGLISMAEFKAYLVASSRQSSEADIQLDVHGSEKLEVTFSRLAPAVGRSESECVAQARQLADRHWLVTVADLRKLEDRDWPRMKLPLKLEVALRAYIGTSSIGQLSPPNT